MMCEVDESEIPPEVIKEMDAIAAQAKLTAQAKLKIMSWGEVFAALIERNYRYLVALFDNDILEMYRIKASTRLIIERRRYAVYDFVAACREHEKAFGVLETVKALRKSCKKKANESKH